MEKCYKFDNDINYIVYYPKEKKGYFTVAHIFTWHW